MHGFYRMPVSVKGSPRLKRYVIRGLHKLADPSLPSTSYGSTTTTKTVTSKPLRSRSVGSVSTKGSRSHHNSVPNLEDETRSKASHHTSLRSRANSVNSVVSRSLTSIQGTSDAAQSIAHSEVRELVQAQVSELLKPLKKEIALSRQATNCGRGES